MTKPAPLRPKPDGAGSSVQLLPLSELPGPNLAMRKLPHPGRWLAAAVVVLLLAVLVRAFALGNIRWEIVGEFLTAPVIIKGFGWTMLITIAALALGVVLGFGFGMMRLSANPVLRYVAWFYVWVFRGTPVLLQLLIWFNIALIFPNLYIPGVVDVKMVVVMTPFVAAVLGLGVNEGSYLTEVVRGGILSVDKGQVEAAHTLGMTPGQTMRRIILPQTMRLILPVLGNSAVGMLKFSSLAATIAMTEMLNAAQRIYFINGAVIEMLFVCALWYLMGTSVLSVGQFYLERHFGRSQGGRA
ncbi:amino acid ABC transporter permease [Xinfangfangia sp. CPCC 101601]|uniref:Amino acid ABC transporter permease n=1 Tax=Pseudogemmobacter lacusdianii TaxID=3069608 RepID=A0ABU0W007_9RHOB|nr:amino acid ABC transporter permease [Xinfangfangia sp. CPCC 101601]MDQ2067307.1 amino acid ABC transporter permease [Xinfangfangia sp. CPCC 101601]